MHFKSTRTLLCLFLFFTASIFFLQSCQKELDFEPGGNVVVKNNLTIEGMITDDSGRPLSGVMVKAGTQQVTTDANGSFRVANANFTTTETFVTATKAGYFTGSRTFFPRANGNNFVRIQLLPRTEAASISAATGGIATVGNATITFAPNSFVNAAGSAYTGTVSVKAAYIDPVNPFINQRMPGDLRGIRTTGELRGLRSFGMMNVELEGSGGEKLQLKSGTPAILSIPIPASMAVNANASMPLWYFDETKGLWIEEGSATKTGNRYTGPVSHFTFWNVDDPFEYVLISMRVVNSSQQPVANVKVKLTSNSDSSCSYDYTDNTGYVDGYVPKNVTLTREVFDECNNVISTGSIGPFTSNTTLGSVSVTFTSNQQTITGTVVNCNNLPVAHGFVIINMPGRTNYATVTNGSFSSTFSTCNGVTSATLIAVDDSTQQQGNPVTVTLTSATVAAGQLQACGTSTQTFLTITVDSVTRTWSVAPYQLLAAEDTVAQSGYHELWITAYDSINSSGPAITLLRPQGNFTAPGVVNFMSMEIYDPLAAPNMIGDYFIYSATQQPTLTQYGAVGQFISGSFSGVFIRNTQQISDTVNVTCSFKVRREPW